MSHEPEKYAGNRTAEEKEKNPEEDLRDGASSPAVGFPKREAHLRATRDRHDWVHHPCRLHPQPGSPGRNRGAEEERCREESGGVYRQEGRREKYPESHLRPERGSVSRSEEH